MNWDDYEKAHALDFSPVRQELLTGCQMCGARLMGSDEKKLKQRRKQHAQLHFYSEVYRQRLMDSMGGASEPSGKLLEYLETMTTALAKEMHSHFANYLRFILDKKEIWPRLKVGQKDSLEYEIKRKWDSLNDREKEGFLTFARDFVETAFPEFKEVPPQKSAAKEGETA